MWSSSAALVWTPPQRSSASRMSRLPTVSRYASRLMPSSGRLSKSGTRVRTPSAIASGRLEALMTGPGSRATVRSSVFSSSRTLPGHGIRLEQPHRLDRDLLLGDLLLLADLGDEVLVSGAMSSVRERRGGSAIGMTLIR